MPHHIPNPYLTRGEAEAICAVYEGESVGHAVNERRAVLKLRRAIAALREEQRERRREQARARRRR